MRENSGNKRIDIRFINQFAIDDFKTKYAGSLLGFVWAFTQPIVTVVIYWFVFQIGFKNEPVNGVPFIIWLVMGLVPWFLFSDAISNATASLVDYNYLVKKVVFDIDVLPLSRIVSMVYVHVILLAFSMILFFAYGCKLQLTIIQVVYYLIYAIVLCTGIVYVTASLYVFFKDVLQLVSILLQVIFWITPIVWRMDIMSSAIQKVLHYNPLFYIVNGYRDSFLEGKWFFEYGFWDNVYFWVVALVILKIGLYTFKKLKPHFADVL